MNNRHFKTSESFHNDQSRKLTGQTPTVKDFITKLNERLLESVAIDTGVLSTKYDDDRWNGRAVILIAVRPDQAAYFDKMETIFIYDNEKFDKLEKESDEAFAWDDTGYSDNVPENGYTHYLLDISEEGLQAALDALDSIKPVTDAERLDILEELSTAL